MFVREVMTANPVCCTADTTLEAAAQLMLTNRCGAIPVVGSLMTRRVVGIITDRDIACRAVSMGKDPARTPVEECMSTPVVTVSPDLSLEACCQLMERHLIRRIPVVNTLGQCEGIITQADIAERAPALLTAEVVRRVSHPTLVSSRVAV